MWPEFVAKQVLYTKYKAIGPDSSVFVVFFFAVTYPMIETY